MAMLPGWRIDKKTGKLVKIDRRNLIQKLQSSSKKKFVARGKGNVPTNPTWNANSNPDRMDCKLHDERGNSKDARTTTVEHST